MSLKKKSLPPAAKKPSKPKVRAKAAASPTADFEKLLRKTAEKERYALKLYVTGTSPRSANLVSSACSLRHSTHQLPHTLST